MSRRRLAALALVAGLLAAGCRVQADVAVTVEEEGTGEVVVAVTLDEEAAERIPDLATQLQATDLADEGWTISEVEATDEGGATVSARKPYGSPAQLEAVLAEVAGEDGPFADLGLERTHELAETEWVFSGEVDTTEGVAAAFSDAELAELLGGQPLGYDLEALGQELGQPVDELVEWSLSADFTEASSLDVEPPGEVGTESRPDGASAHWSGTFADEEPTSVLATASRVDQTTRILAAVAALALLLLVVLLLVRLVRRRRRRKRERRAQAEAAAASVGQPARAGIEGTSVRPVVEPDAPPTAEQPVVPPPPPPPPPPVAPTPAPALDPHDADLWEDEDVTGDEDEDGGPAADGAPEPEDG